MDDDALRLTLKIEGPLTKDGRVPISVLANKLTTLQDVFFNIGSALIGGGSRGMRKSEVNEDCSLIFLQTNQGSIEIVTEIPRPRQPTLPTFKSLGQRTLEQLDKTLQAIESKDTSILESLYPTHGARMRVLKSAVKLFPDEDSGYQLSIKPNGRFIRLESSLVKYLNDYTRETIDEEPDKLRKTISGDLYLIEVETGAKKIGIIYKNRKVMCHYEKEYEDDVKNLIAGSFVEVEGFATLNEYGEVHEIDRIIEIRPIQLNPIYKQRIEYDDRIFNFKQTMEIKVDYQDGVWIYEYPPLKLMGYGDTRKKASEGFYMDFVACWDCVAKESNEKLTQDAIMLKEKLLSLAEESERKG